MSIEKSPFDFGCLDDDIVIVDGIDKGEWDNGESGKCSERLLRIG